MASVVAEPARPSEAGSSTHGPVVLRLIERRDERDGGRGANSKADGGSRVSRRNFSAALRTTQRAHTTPEVMNGDYVTGETDVILIVTARSMKDHETLTRKFFHENPDINGLNIMVIMVCVKDGFAIPAKLDGILCKE
ncbi:Lrp/AsnC ligand binding domain-containing protein [Ancylobacter sp. VNQ12]|uniref:Lrp/AsnC ligand binding domain-containing protein n=1 Tax=Ancylobacter sp. VNQ12 TaxID=3400920 RepID=UPI003C08067C